MPSHTGHTLRPARHDARSKRVIGLEKVDAVRAVNDGNLDLCHEIIRRMADEDSDMLVLELLLEAADLLFLSDLRVGIL